MYEKDKVSGRIGLGEVFDLIHVGKCAGSSLKTELDNKGFKFGYFHVKQPLIAPEARYVVLVRDPIARFVSAVNWRRYRLENGLNPPIPPSEVENVRLKNRLEFDFLSQFSTVNELAERATPYPGIGVSPMMAMLGLVGHAMTNFTWHLSTLVEQIAPEQLMGVITQERFAEDVEAVFGFHPVEERNRHYPSRGTALSPLGRANLAEIFKSDFLVLQRLSALANRAGRPMSVAYDPVSGASHVPPVCGA